MIITKKFSFEGAHIVRDCTSVRCRKSIHGHSYKVEVKLTSNRLDNGQMVVDFGLLKKTVKDFVDSFDHTYTMWDSEKFQFMAAIQKFSDRWIILPVSPSAEMLAVTFFAVIDRILYATQFNNGEGGVALHSVVIHETATGCAEAFREDAIQFMERIDKISFSQAVKDEWNDPDMWDKILLYERDQFINPKIKLKYAGKV